MEDETRQPIGTGPTIVAILAGVLALLSLAQLYFLVTAMRQAGPEVWEVVGRSGSFVTILLILVTMAALALASYLLVRTREPLAVRVAALALLLFFPFRWLLDLGSIIVLERRVPEISLNVWHTVDALPTLVAVPYLLLSKQVARVYGSRTRAVIADGVPQLWRKIRGRAPASHLDD